MSAEAGARPPLLLVATRSHGKLHELTPMIEGAGFRAFSLADAGIEPTLREDHLEVFHTFEQNALAKARYFHHHVEGMAVLADDSGLEVEALDGQPGVRSKRWSGSALTGRALDDANNQLLLHALEGESNRRARFVCVAAIVWSGGELTGRGETTGRILETSRGVQGFGYDPLFLSDALGVTFAEASREQKETVSHRGRAMQSVLARFARSH